jgi:hypothetical protein
MAEAEAAIVETVYFLSWMARGKILKKVVKERYIWVMRARLKTGN